LSLELVGGNLIDVGWSDLGLSKLYAQAIQTTAIASHPLRGKPKTSKMWSFGYMNPWATKIFGDIPQNAFPSAGIGVEEVLFLSKTSIEN
jgi:hypothetical protein